SYTYNRAEKVLFSQVPAQSTYGLKVNSYQEKKHKIKETKEKYFRGLFSIIVYFMIFLPIIMGIFAYTGRKNRLSEYGKIIAISVGMCIFGYIIFVISIVTESSLIGVFGIIGLLIVMASCVWMFRQKKIPENKSFFYTFLLLIIYMFLLILFKMMAQLPIAIEPPSDLGLTLFIISIIAVPLIILINGVYHLGGKKRSETNYVVMVIAILAIIGCVVIILAIIAAFTFGIGAPKAIKTAQVGIVKEERIPSEALNIPSMVTPTPAPTSTPTEKYKKFGAKEEKIKEKKDIRVRQYSRDFI
ncbi:MAG: hypothetical protein ACE5J3_06845, partial [Methanosarcinales archaeon]